MLPAAIAPIVGSPVVPSSARWSIGSKGSIWPPSASRASTSASGVPARAAMTSSAGSYRVMPVSPAAESVASSCAGRPIPARVPPPTSRSRSRRAAAAPIRVAASASLLGW